MFFTFHFPRIILVVLTLLCIHAISAPGASTITGLTLLVTFPDSPRHEIIPIRDIDALLNAPRYNRFGNSSSLKQYWENASNGSISFNNSIIPYYTALHPKKYYDSGTRGGRSQELIHEVLNFVHTTYGIPLAQFDTNNDSIVDALTVLYTGSTNQQWGNGLWPHFNTLTKPWSNGSHTVTQFIMAPLFTSGYTHPTIGSIVHESAHLLFGWPDLYGASEDLIYSDGLMGLATSATHPPEPSIYFKALEGWLSDDQLDTLPSEIYARVIAPELSIDSIISYHTIPGIESPPPHSMQPPIELSYGQSAIHIVGTQSESMTLFLYSVGGALLNTFFIGNHTSHSTIPIVKSGRFIAKLSYDKTLAHVEATLAFTHY